MTKVMLFGSGSIPEITQEIANALMSLYTQAGGDIKFMLGDGNGLDQAFNEFLSRAGYTMNTEVFGMDYIRNNKFKHNENVLRGMYNSDEQTVTVIDKDNNIMHVINSVEDLDKFIDTSKWYTALDKSLARTCDIAICVWDGKTKAEKEVMNLLSILDKPCYTYIIEI